MISHATHREHSDVHRYEKISNIIKQFKLSCSKTQSQFKSMEVSHSAYHIITSAWRITAWMHHIMSYHVFILDHVLCVLTLFIHVHQVKNKNFTAFIDVFTTNTYIMIIISNPKIQSAATNLNIQVARPHFEKFVQQFVGQ